MTPSRPSKPSSRSRTFRTLLPLLLLVFWSGTAQGATSELRILVNVDVNPNTGCDVTTADGVFPGV